MDSAEMLQLAREGRMPSQIDPTAWPVKRARSRCAEEVIPAHVATPAGCPDPAVAEAVRQGVAGALAGAQALPVEHLPHAAPPFAAVFWYRSVLAVLDASAAGTGAATALATAVGMNVTALQPTVTAVTDTTTPVNVLTYLVPSGIVLRLSGFGWRPHSFFGRRALLPRVTVNGQAPIIDGAVNEMPYAPPEEPFPIHAIVTEGKLIQVQFVNQNSLSPYAVEVRLQGWAYPAATATQSRMASWNAADPARGGD